MSTKSIVFVLTLFFIIASGLLMSKCNHPQKQEVITLPASSTPEGLVESDTTCVPHLSDVDCNSIKTFEQYYDIRHDLGNELYNIVTAETVKYEENLRELTELIQVKKKSEIQKLKVEHPQLYEEWMRANISENFLEKERIEKLQELRDFVLKMIFHTENHHIVSQILLTKHNEAIRAINEEYTKKGI